MEIIIDKENYKRCVEFACNMWANEKKASTYNSGMLNSKKDPYKVERIGALGEMAFSIFAGVDPDFAYCKGGKRVDFTINETTIDVKTAAKYPDYRATLIRCLNEYGTYVKPSCDIYVSAYVETEVPGESAVVELVGWHKREEILEQQPVRARRKGASHFNYELSFDVAHSIDDLKEFLNV